MIGHAGGRLGAMMAFVSMAYSSDYLRKGLLGTRSATASVAARVCP